MNTSSSDGPLAYIPLDRRYALAANQILPSQTSGTVLFADISGFTPLTEALVQQYGVRRGVDELASTFNHIFDILIAEIHAYGGSTIGFAGDAITCWFDKAPPHQHVTKESSRPLAEVSPSPYASPHLRAIAAACAMQQALSQAAQIKIGDAVTVTLELKVAIASGTVRRFLVGHPDIQRIDVLAGSVLDRMAAGEQLAAAGEILIDQQSAAALSETQEAEERWTIEEWRMTEMGEAFGLLPRDAIADINERIQPVEAAPLDRDAIPPDAVRQWVLPPVYQRIQSQDRFLAELRPAAALFLKFSGINYEEDPEAGQKLDAYVRWVQSAVDTYAGSLIQLTFGDKGSYLYAAFGAPIAHDDNLERAAATALTLLHPPADLDYITSTKIGITQGRMRVGAYGSPTRQTYAVLGDATNVAARLMSRATYGQILVNEQVFDEIGNTFEFQELGYATFKGKSEPQAIFALLGHRTQHADTITSQYASPLVGRDAELSTIDNLLHQTSANQSGILRISGEAGIGKSHLAAVILQQAQANSFQIAIGGCQSTAQEAAYYPIRPIVRQLLGLPESDGHASPPVQQNLNKAHLTKEQQNQISHLEATLQVTNPDWLLRLPLLGDLLGLPIPETPTTAAFDPQLRREALITLVIDIVQSRARQQPLLLLIEDIHWMDEASQELILGLARAQAELPILLMLMHRPTMRTSRGTGQPPADSSTTDSSTTDSSTTGSSTTDSSTTDSSTTDGSTTEQTFLTRLAELPNQTYIDLSELTPEGTAALVTNMLASEKISSLALDLIQGLAQGNPFYVEELVEALLDSQQLIPTNGVWTLTQKVTNALRAANLLIRQNDEARLRPGASLAEVDLGIPDSIHGIVLARLDRLPEPVKLTLKVASVIGHIFEFEMLAHAHPTIDQPETLIEQFELIEERDFAKLDTPEPQPRYIFRHNITQEVVYRTLLDEQRHDLHLAVGNAVETLQPDSVERLAYHFYNSDLEEAEVRTKAMEYLGEAGDRAKRDYANETALAFYDRALGLEERWAWMKGKIELLHLLGQRQEEMETLDYAEYINVAPVVELAAAWGEYYESVGDYPAAVEKIESGIGLAEAADDVKEALRGRIRLADIDLRQGDYVGAERQYLEALEELEDHTEFYDEKARALYGVGIVKRNTGEYEAASSFLQETLSLHKNRQDRQQETKALTALGFTAFSLKNYAGARDYYRQAQKIQNTIGDQVGSGESLLYIGQVQISEGEYTEALAHLNQALTIQKVTNNRWFEAIVWGELGILYMFVGNWEKAISSFENGKKLCEEIKTEVLEAYITCNLGLVYREIGKFTDSALALNKSLKVAESQNEKPLEVACLGELALLHLWNGHYQESIDCSMKSLRLKASGEVSDTITDLTRLAITHLNMGKQEDAQRYAHQALSFLETSNSQVLDYPHREYFRCYWVFEITGQALLANQMIDSAYKLLTEKAGKITDPHMKQSFLKNVSSNWEIMEEARRLGIAQLGYAQ